MHKVPEGARLFQEKTSRLSPFPSVLQSRRAGRLPPGKGWGTQCSPPPARVWATRPNLRPILQEPISYAPSGRVVQAPDGPPCGHSRLRAFPRVGIPGLGGHLCDRLEFQRLALAAMPGYLMDGFNGGCTAADGCPE